MFLQGLVTFIFISVQITQSFNSPQPPLAIYCLKKKQLHQDLLRMLRRTVVILFFCYLFIFCSKTKPVSCLLVLTVICIYLIFTTGCGNFTFIKSEISL